MAIKLQPIGSDPFGFAKSQALGYPTAPVASSAGQPARALADPDPYSDPPPSTGGETGGGTGTGDNGNRDTQSPCAPGYKKEFKSDGSFECVPEGQAPPCSYDSSGNYVTDSARRERVSAEECKRRGDLNIKNNPNPTEGGSGGTGGSGGGAPAPPKPNWEPWAAPAKTPFELELEQQLRDFMGNWKDDVPFTDSVIGNLKTDAFRATKGRSLAEQRAIEADSIRRGVLRSTGTDRRLDAQRNEASSQYAAAERGIETTATQANFQARTANRLAALDRAEQHVNAEREFLMTNEMNHFARQQGMNQLALAYYSIQNQRFMLKMQLDNSNYQFDKSFDWQKQMDILMGLLGGSA